MSAENGRLQKQLPLAPQWIVMAAALVALVAIYIYHLLTGWMPDRAAFTVLGLDVFWYGICIVGGIVLGCYVVARLAEERGQRLFVAAVPPTVRQRSLASLPFPDDIHEILQKNNVTTMGDLLWYWGIVPARLGLNDEGRRKVAGTLRRQPDINETWVAHPAWARWSPDHVWSGIIWCLILAVIGARLYHVLTPSPSMAAVGIESPLDYFRNPVQIVNLRRGGLGIYGGIVGGALGLYLYARRQRIPMLAWADLAVIGLALGQVFGRWGNFFNQELYGNPTTLPWAVAIDPVYRLPGYESVSRFHPAFLYESLWNLMTFFVLFTLLRRYREHLWVGELTGAYLICYGIGRILLEQVRLDSATVTLAGLNLNVSVATLVSLVVAVAMAVAIGVRRWQAAGD